MGAENEQAKQYNIGGRTDNVRWLLKVFALSKKCVQHTELRGSSKDHQFTLCFLVAGMYRVT